MESVVGLGGGTPRGAAEGDVCAVAAQDEFTLSALHAATMLTGSLVLALAMADRRIAADQAFAAATIDETYQAEKWGMDSEAEKRLKRHAEELSAAERFLSLL